MDFSELYSALLETLKGKVSNGEISERRLARLSGISQPHIHNVLKRKRIFSPAACDKILRRMGMTVFDLLRFPPGSSREMCADCLHRRQTVEVPILEGRLGPGLPVPTAVDILQSHPFQSSFITTLQGAAVARLARDEAMAGWYQENDLALLDHSRVRRLHPEPEGLYVINRDGEGLVRGVRLGPGRTLLLLSAGLGGGRPAERWPLGERHLLDVIRARVVWIGRYLVGR